MADKKRGTNFTVGSSREIFMLKSLSWHFHKYNILPYKKLFCVTWILLYIRVRIYL